MNIINRLLKLEKRRNEQPQNVPAVIEIYGTRPDGTQFLFERRERNKDGCFVTVEKPAVTILLPDNHRGDL